MKYTCFLLLAGWLLSRSLATAGSVVDANNSRTGPFILGAEVSWVPEDEADGAVYYDHGVAWRRQRFGGRYDANELFNLYPQMAKDYAVGSSTNLSNP
jgi:hypothetical protein